MNLFHKHVDVMSIKQEVWTLNDIEAWEAVIISCIHDIRFNAIAAEDECREEREKNSKEKTRRGKKGVIMKRKNAEGMNASQKKKEGSQETWMESSKNISGFGTSKVNLVVSVWVVREGRWLSESPQGQGAQAHTPGARFPTGYEHNDALPLRNTPHQTLRHQVVTFYF